MPLVLLALAHILRALWSRGICAAAVPASAKTSAAATIEGVCLNIRFLLPGSGSIMAREPRRLNPPSSIRR